jgi:hypothetical protein
MGLARNSTGTLFTPARSTTVPALPGPDGLLLRLVLSPSAFSSPYPDGKGLILASDCLIRYLFSAEFAKKSVACFGRRLFQALIGGIPMIFVPKICRYRSITGGKVGGGTWIGLRAGEGEQDSGDGCRMW